MMCLLVNLRTSSFLQRLSFFQSILMQDGHYLTLNFFSSQGTWTVFQILKVIARAEARLSKMALMFKEKI